MYLFPSALRFALLFYPFGINFANDDLIDILDDEKNPATKLVSCHESGHLLMPFVMWRKKAGRMESTNFYCAILIHYNLFPSVFIHPIIRFPVLMGDSNNKDMIFL